MAVVSVDWKPKGFADGKNFLAHLHAEESPRERVKVSFPWDDLDQSDIVALVGPPMNFAAWCDWSPRTTSMDLSALTT